MYSDEPVDWVLDGEFGGSRTEVRIENLKQRIRIMRGREILGQEIGAIPEKLIGEKMSKYVENPS